MNRTTTKRIIPPPTGRSGASRRPPVPVTNLAGLTHQLALARSAIAAQTAHHRDDLQTMGKAYRELYAEHVDLKARAEAAEQLAHERLSHLQTIAAGALERAEKLQVERDAFSKAARDAREAAAKANGQLAASKEQIAELLARLGVPPPKAQRASPSAPPKRVPIVPRQITVGRGAKKS